MLRVGDLAADHAASLEAPLLTRHVPDMCPTCAKLKGMQNKRCLHAPVCEGILVPMTTELCSAAAEAFAWPAFIVGRARLTCWCFVAARVMW